MPRRGVESCNKDFREDHSDTARLQRARGSRRAESGRKHLLPKPFSGPKEWNIVTQPWTSTSKTQKARDPVPQVPPFYLREKLRDTLGNGKSENSP